MIIEQRTNYGLLHQKEVKQAEKRGVGKQISGRR
nr:MAG TPA: hypothetical protein [Caudoviricetes sp.]